MFGFICICCISLDRGEKSFKLTLMLAVNKFINDCSEKNKGSAIARTYNLMRPKGKNSSICYFHTNLIVLKLLLHSLCVSFLPIHNRKKGFNFHCYYNVPFCAMHAEGCLTLRPSGFTDIICFPPGLILRRFNEQRETRSILLGVIVAEE